jgi:biotin carboxylase
MKQPRRILIIGAAREHCFGIKKAQEMGLQVIAVDGNPDSEGFRITENHLLVSTYDHEAILEGALKFIAKGNNIDGVMTLASDVPYSVAYVAHHLGLPGIGLASAKNASEKILMKDCFNIHSVPIPAYREVYSLEDLEEAKNDMGLPIIIKPVDSRGARGVQVIQNPDMLESQYAHSLACSPQKRVMVEEYLAGPQLSTEGAMINGEVYIPAIFDRNYEYMDKYAPHIVENGGEMPSVYSEKYNNNICKVMKSAALALGIKNGIIKGDLVIHNDQVKVIELAARLSGGFFGTVATKVSSGVDLVEINIRLALGEEIPTSLLKPKFNRAAAIRFAFPEAGRIRSIKGVDDVKSDDHCSFAHLFVKEGDSILDIIDHPSRPAVVVAADDTLDGAINHSQRLIDSLVWHIDH